MSEQEKQDFVEKYWDFLPTGNSVAKRMFIGLNQLVILYNKDVDNNTIGLHTPRLYTSKFHRGYRTMFDETIEFFERRELERNQK